MNSVVQDADEDGDEAWSRNSRSVGAMRELYWFHLVPEFQYINLFQNDSVRQPIS